MKTLEATPKEFLFSASKSNQNLPAFWEKRQDTSFLTSVELIATGNFGKKMPIFLNNNNGAPESFHALFVASIGDIILRVLRSTNKRERYELFVITKAEPTGDKFTLTCDLVKETYDPSEIIDEYATAENMLAAKDFFDAARGKLDLDRKVSVYAQVK